MAYLRIKTQPIFLPTGFFTPIDPAGEKNHLGEKIIFLSAP